MSTTNNERADFEAAAIRISTSLIGYTGELDNEQDADGNYTNGQVQMAWLLWQARASLAANAPAAEPVAWLWQHSETGRTRVVMPDQIFTTDAAWSVVGPLTLTAPPQGAAKGATDAASS